MVLLYASIDGTPLLARGRGIGKLIEGLMAGDPVAWSITVGVVVILIGIAVFKHYNRAESE